MKQLYLWRSGLLSLLFYLMTIQISWAQSTVSGTITDEKNQPVIGASVQVKGTTTGVVSDANGKYAIKTPSPNSVLVITYIGYVKLEVPTAGKTVVNIALKPETTSLNEVVVTGYSSQRKKDLTGSVAVVSVEQLKAQPAASAVEALQGKAAGVQIVNDGSPGSTPQVRVRGYSTINNNDPLYVVDGVPVDGKLNWLNQNDIESMTVLKDASAASIYGARANNGVIVITTKKGRQGPPQISLDAYYGVQSPRSSSFPSLMSPQQYADYLVATGQPDAANYGSGATAVLPDYLVAGSQTGQAITAADADPSKYNYSRDPATFYQITQANKAGTNWFDAITRNAPLQNYQLSATGGGENSTYAVSGGMLDQQGTLEYTGFKRYNIRSNTSFSAFDKKFRFGENAQYSYTRGNGTGVSPNVPGDYQGEGSPLGMAYRIPTIIPVYDIAGNFAGSRGSNLGNAQNPLALLYRAKDNVNNSNIFFGNAFAELDIVTGLVARTSIGIRYENYDGRSQNYPTPEFSEGSITNNNLSEYSGTNREYTWTNTLNYNKTFNEKHKLTILAGTEAINFKNRGITAARNDYFLLGNQDYYYLNSGTTNIANGGTGSTNSLFSIFGRADYAYADKYLLSATLRRDGSSNFGSNNLYGYFPAASAAWRFSEEEFMKGVSWLSDAKFRVGYGETGNQRIPAFNFIARSDASLINSSYSLGGNNNVTAGVWQSSYANPDIKWEALKSLNVGLDYTLLKGDIDGSFDWYSRKTTGVLYNVPAPATAVGQAAVPFRNLGDVSNKGVEFNINYHYGRQNDNPFKFDVGFNIAHNKNILSTLSPDVPQQPFGNFRSLTVSILQPGKPFGSFYGYKIAGIYQNTGELTSGAIQEGARVGGFKYTDVNGDGRVTPDDRTILGNPNPDFTYGINLNASYKNFDIAAFFYGSQGNDLYDETRYFTDFPSFIGARSTRLLDTWSPTNTSSLIPSPKGILPIEYESNSYYVQDGSYFRMKNLQIGYTLPSKIFGDKLKISKLRVYVSGTNLFTITNYTGIDPEVIQSFQTFSLPGVDQGVYPTPRQFLFGVNASF